MMQRSVVLLAMGALLPSAAAFCHCTAAPMLQSTRGRALPPRLALRCAVEGGGRAAAAPPRRSVLAAAGAAAAGLVLGGPCDAQAFDNRVVAKGRYPPTPGPKPKGVGEGPSKDGQLKFCTGEPPTYNVYMYCVLISPHNTYVCMHACMYVFMCVCVRV